MKPITDKKAHVAEVSKRLKKLYPDAYVELNFTNPLELLIASVLAAQNTDVNVNRVTADLFRKYKTPSDYENASLVELEQDIHSTGFFRQKAKSIYLICQMINRHFGGNVPGTMEELIRLPGIGRKTANVVLGYAFGVTSGIVVDVHNLRVNPRLGISEQKDAKKMEFELMELVPKKDWIDYGQWITWHGRRVCHARKPDCDNCVLNDICPSALNIL